MISSRGQGVHGLWILKYEISKLIRQGFVTFVALCRRVHFGKLIFTYPVKKFLSFYENRVFVTVVTRYHQRSRPKPFASHTTYFFDHVNRLTPNDPYMGRTTPLTSKRCILYVYSANIGSEYFKHALYSPFFFLFKMQFVS